VKRGLQLSAGWHPRQASVLVVGDGLLMLTPASRLGQQHRTTGAAALRCTKQARRPEHDGMRPLNAQMFPRPPDAGSAFSSA
jgi:hypothetical protein